MPGLARANRTGQYRFKSIPGGGRCSGSIRKISARAADYLCAGQDTVTSRQSASRAGVIRGNKNGRRNRISNGQEKHC
jgi:hypothetical protein